MKSGIAALIALAASCVGASADTGFLDRSVVVGSQTHRYQVYIPVDHGPERRWPVIVDLHGDGLQGSDGVLQTSRGLAAQIRQRRSAFPAIVLFPQARVGTRFLAPASMQDLIIMQLDRTIAEFNGDSARVYLMGFSMGGGSVYRLAYRWPEKFAALVVIGGFVVPPSMAPPAAVELDARTNAFAAAGDPFVALAERIRRIPIWICHGAADNTVEQARRMIQALKQAEAPARYVEQPETDHVGSAQKGYSDAEMVTWLFALRR